MAHFLTADFSLSPLPYLARWHTRYSASRLSGDHPSTAHLAGPRDGGGFPEHVCRERVGIRLPQLSSAAPSPALRVGLAHEVGSVRPGQQIDTVVSQGVEEINVALVQRRDQAVVRLYHPPLDGARVRLRPADGLIEVS